MISRTGSKSCRLAALAVTLPLAAVAAPTWQTVSSEPGKRIEIDRASIKRAGTTVEAVSRLVLDKALVDVHSGAPYRIIEVATRYDCTTRNANTLRRTFRKIDNAIVREEMQNGVDLPVHSGTHDAKILHEVCRPPKDSQARLVDKVNEAASQLRQANETLLKKERARPPAASKSPPARKESSGAGYMLELVPPPKSPPPDPGDRRLPDQGRALTGAMFAAAQL